MIKSIIIANSCAEYIGQLESEVAARTNEAYETRLQNRALYDDNARLNDLARMLLGSPHFAKFLNEIPDTIHPQVPVYQPPQQPQQQLQQAPVLKEATAPSPRSSRYSNTQSIMAMVPN